MRARVHFLGLVGLAALAAGCGGGDGGGGEAGRKCPGADTSGCSIVLAPSGDDSKTLQTALIEGAKSGDTVCLCPGSYALSKELSLAIPNVTVRGAGAAVEDTVLDFAGQIEGDDGFSVTSDGFTIENLWIKNSPGNGIVVDKAEDVTFRKLKVSWDAGSVVTNGAYAVYPVNSTRVTIEDSEVIGASDAGIYVGQCNQAIVRRNKVHGNVAGIEIENTTDADVYDNDSFDNAAGILIFTLPNLAKKDGAKARIHDNRIHDNNRANFAEPGSIVSNVPTGTGVLVMASDDTHIYANTIENNQSTGILMVSLTTLNILLQTQPDPATDPDPERTFIHGNSFASNGATPQGVLDLFGVAPLEDVVWDGVVKPTATEPALCLGQPPLPSFRNIHAPEGLSDNAAHTTDPTPYQCELLDLLPLSW
jgi:parallel beta-helix repeat protein